MIEIAFIDLETRSRIDLPKHGSYAYWEDASTDVLIACYALGDGPVKTWHREDPVPADLAEHIRAGGVVSGWNANGFERLAFNYVLGPRYGWPVPSLEQWSDTMHLAVAMSLPAALGRAAAVLGLDAQKDKDGMRLIRKFSIPQKDGSFREPKDEPADFEKFSAYCRLDVEVERAARARLVPLSEHERRVVALDATINDRGLRIDVASAFAAVSLAEKAKGLIDREIAAVTGGEVRRLSEVAKLKTWAEGRGVLLDSLDKATIAETLEMDDIPQDVRHVLELRSEGGKTSVTKIDGFLKRASRDGRVRGCYSYHGASTGRWTSTGVNVSNLPRTRHVYDEAKLRTDLLFASIREGDPDYLRFTYGDDLGRSMHLLSDAVRGFIWAAPGHDFVQADYSNIEGSVIAWLAGEEWKLAAMRDIFADPANIPDLYRQTAAKIMNTTTDVITKKHPLRQSVGKVSELACFSSETKVLTDNGVKAIVEVLPTDKLWDGVEWISHQGVISKGARQVVNVDGIRVTPDHFILTGRTWKPAVQLATRSNTLSRALATGSANLPWRGSNTARLGASDTSRPSALAAALQMMFSRPIFVKGRLLAALAAPEGSRPNPAISCTTGTKMSYPTTSTGRGCSTALLLATGAASTQRTEATETTAGAASVFFGAEIVGRFWNTLSRLKAGIVQSWRSTGSTTMETTRRATFASLRGQRTPRTREARAKCLTGSSTSKTKTSNCVPVYDILNAGPRHRFTVCSDNGYLIAHNCGFGGGASAFITMANNYRVDLDAIHGPVWEKAAEEDREKAQKRYEFCYKRNQSGARLISQNAWVACELIKRGWRAQNAAIAQSWRDAENAAREAVENPGTITEAARCRFVSRFGYLWMLLPSGRALCFPKPSLSAQVWVALKVDGELLDAEVMEREVAEKLERAGKAEIQGDTSPSISYWGVDAKTRQWSKKKTYGGDLVQSATQATARDVLVNGMFKAEDAGYRIVLHTYDEMLCEVPRDFGDLAAFEKLICELPAWADGLPVAAGGYRSKRYKKD